MDMPKLKPKVICLFCLLIAGTYTSCKKLIEIDPPINTVTTIEVFDNDALALSAMAGVYSVMINGNRSSYYPGLNTGFCTGLTTALAGISSDELYTQGGSTQGSYYLYNTNHITALNSGISTPIWTSAYNAIYGSNSVIEGIAASKSPELHDKVRNELTAEAKFVRAFCYFYLTNFFGDVPMALTVDFNQTQNLRRMPRQEVYQQIIKDLKAAQTALPADYSAGNDERIVPNKWAATLLLARAYLYTGNYADAAAQATAVINHTSLYDLEGDLNSVFLTGSREAIWQLKQTTENATLKNATPEGYEFNETAGGFATYGLTNQLLSDFETGDQRSVAWVGNTGTSSATPMSYPYKYKIGSTNGGAGQPALEYYVVLRLAEAYLIRAEAEANGVAGGTGAAIADLKVIRNRAGLPDLANNLSQQQVIAAVAKERRLEFFAEWGHRWFDLKRTGTASSVLSVIPLKQPWEGDYQLLYPIPLEELKIDRFLTQNPGY
jgi:hypothetical protein